MLRPCPESLGVRFVLDLVTIGVAKLDRRALFGSWRTSFVCPRGGSCLATFLGVILVQIKPNVVTLYKLDQALKNQNVGRKITMDSTNGGCTVGAVLFKLLGVWLPGHALSVLLMAASTGLLSPIILLSSTIHP